MWTLTFQISYLMIGILISNKDCLTLDKKEFPNKKLNDFIVTSSNVNETGKIIIENNNYLTLQRGKPYFFPNCKNDNLMNKVNLQYKLVSPDRIQHRLKTDRSILLNYSNRLKLSMKRNLNFKYFSNDKMSRKFEFSKLFIKKDGKLYSSLIPKFLKKFSIQNTKSNLNINQILRFEKLKKKKKLKIPKFNKSKKKKKSKKQKKPNEGRILLVKSSDLVENTFKEDNNFSSQLALVKFVEHSFEKMVKSVGLYSITEDFFEHSSNAQSWRCAAFFVAAAYLMYASRLRTCTP